MSVSVVRVRGTQNNTSNFSCYAYLICSSNTYILPTTQSHLPLPPLESFVNKPLCAFSCFLECFKRSSEPAPSIYYTHPVVAYSAVVIYGVWDLGCSVEVKSSRPGEEPLHSLLLICACAVHVVWRCNDIMLRHCPCVKRSPSHAVLTDWVTNEVQRSCHSLAGRRRSRP